MKIIITVLSLFIVAGCSSSKINTGMIHEQAPVIIYMTTADYFNNVPITLNEAKDKIISYPAPTDLSYEGEVAYPIKLEKGFLLDRRGVGANTVFTSFTFEEYAALDHAPSLDELFESIVDLNPMKVVCNCGHMSDYKDLISELNRKIEAGLDECNCVE